MLLGSERPRRPIEPTGYRFLGPLDRRRYIVIAGSCLAALVVLRACR